MFCSAGVLYLLKSLMRKVPIALFLYTPMIVIFLACSGKTITLWSWPCLLVYVQHLTFFLQLQTWRSGSSRKSMTWTFSFIIWTISTPFGPPNSQACQRNLDTCIQQFWDWEILLHLYKLEGPSTLLTALGIELDSLLLQARLPQETFDRIHTLLVSWSQKCHCTQEELESLIGNLQHASSFIPSGRIFLRRMINLLSAFSQRGPSFKA